MKKQVLALAALALATSGAFAQANDTLAKIKSSGAVTMGVRDSSGALRGSVRDGAAPGTSCRAAALAGVGLAGFARTREVVPVLR